MKAKLTVDQLEALQRYSAVHGRTWKHQLWLEWQDGTDRGLLRQIRNTFGPSWLVKFSLKKTYARVKYDAFGKPVEIGA